ncbi:LLM class flavin-dependent oxidoreductase [Candidatus Entotheonella palauensis]|uniref:LLM class flavin-dependent oxidoreductase n=1 Tax=Candidatus Entotheonella palauensis TaxID=93172 RepID=UPI000B7F18C3|nr:LLM class flavin-dependent oxidoreductase [Candidatus Entotheonella palauensis]
MQFGFSISSFERIETSLVPAAHREMLEQAALADQLGFDSIWIAEQHFSFERQCPSPFLLGTAVAMHTQQSRIGVYTTMSYTHPVRIAEDAAVLDVLCGGRLILCAGTGYRPDEFAAYGLTAKGKRGRLREILEILPLAWRDAPFVYEGKYFRVPAPVEDETADGSPLGVFPKPVQNPIPIWMAAFGNVGVRQAGRLGMPLYTSPIETLAQLQARDTLYREAMHETSQNQSVFPLLRNVYVADTYEQARADTEVSLQIQSRRYQTWRPEAGMPKPFEEVTADRFIIGSPDQCLAEIDRYVAKLGVNYLVCRMNMPGLSHDKVMASMRLFAEAVMPSCTASD